MNVRYWPKADICSALHMSAFGSKADMAVCGIAFAPLLGAKRTCPFALHMSANDPKRTLRQLGAFRKRYVEPVRCLVLSPLGAGMRRREFITLLGGAATASLAWSRVAFAQQPSTKVFRIKFPGSPTADSLPERPEAFRVGLRDLGYQEGRDFVIEYRWADGNYDRLPALIADLARLNVDVIVTHGTPGALAAKTATTIPVVLAVVGDPLGSGIVSSLARPGGNVTGLAISSLRRARGKAYRVAQGDPAGPDGRWES